MGTWGPGNFENDAALDFVGEIAGEVAKELHPTEEIEDLDIIMAAVGMTAALVKNCHAPAPDRGRIETLRAQVLHVYDEQIDDLEPTAKYRDQRRIVIEQSFDELLALLGERA